MHDLDPSIADTLHSLNPPDETEIVISGADLKGGLAAAEGHRKWQYQSAEKLRDIRRSLEHDMHEKSNEQLAEMIFVATGFDGVDDFILPEARELAQDCLTKVATNLESRGAQHLRDIICIILNSQLKPLFLPSPHPKVNLRTGRRLHVPNGGQPATADFYDDQTWKVEGRGCWNTLKWCISNLERGDYELLWPSLIPPLMTILDDHDLKFRITAIEILQELIRRVDRTLLKRTGIESLFAASLSISITYYNDPEAPVLLLEAVNCSRQLIELTAIPESQDRFERLSDLTTRAIIGGAWLYAGDKLPIMEASIEALIPLVSALHIGTCRFLKALIPQLSENLIPKHPLPSTHRLLYLSAECLIRIIEVCEPRIPPWRGTILEGLFRAWVHSRTDGTADPDNTALQNRLRMLCLALKDACPTMLDHEIPTLVSCDAPMFEGLLVPARSASDLTGGA